MAKSTTPAEMDQQSLENFRSQLELRATIRESSSEDATRNIIEKVLAFENVDDILAGNVGGVLSSDSLIGEPLELLDVHWNRSDFNDGMFEYYAVVDAVRQNTGEKIVFSISATTAMAQLFKLESGEHFPQVVQIVRSDKQTRNGYYPKWLARPAEAGETA